MALEFVDGAAQRVEHIIALIYGIPSIGKTTLAMTSAAPAVLDFDQKSYKASNKTGKAILTIDKWPVINNFEEEDFAPYQTIVVDTVGAALECLSNDIISKNPKHGRSGGLSLQGFGELKSRFTQWLSRIREQGKDIVLLAHAVEEQRDEETVHRILATGGSRQVIYAAADIMGHFYINAQNDRALTFTPAASRFCKNVGTGIADQNIRDAHHNPDAMARIITEAKRLINEASDVQVEAQAKMEMLREALEPFTTRAQFEDVRKAMAKRKASPMEKRLLVDIAETKGFVLDKTTGAFAADPAAVPKEERPPELPGEEELPGPTSEQKKAGHSKKGTDIPKDEMFGQ